MTCKHAVAPETEYVCPKCACGQTSHNTQKMIDESIESYKSGILSDPVDIEELNRIVHIGNTDFGFGKIQM